MKQIIDARELKGKEIISTRFLFNGDVVIRFASEEFVIIGQTSFSTEHQTSISQVIISHIPDEYNYDILYVLDLISKDEYVSIRPDKDLFERRYFPI